MEALEPVEVQRARCEEQREMLRKLARIHIDIDAPKRTIASDEPDWVFRLRKVCLHAAAITKCEVSADGLHVMAAELRPAYEQMDDIWKRLPDEFRFAADGSWWSSEARRGLASYNHPTMTSLVLPLATGGFADAEDPRSYLQLAVWAGPSRMRIWAGARPSGASAGRRWGLRFPFECGNCRRPRDASIVGRIPLTDEIAPGGARAAGIAWPPNY